jgi:outer membrane protein assembly factor BamB
MKPRCVVAIALGAMLIIVGAGCRREVAPERPSQASGPDRTWTGIPTTYTVSAHIDRGTIRFVADWGDMVDTTDARYASGETATIAHVWTSAGTMSVKVQAINSAAPEKASVWSWPESVRVILDSLPVIDTVEAPQLVIRGVEVYFTVRASDPDADTIKTCVDWGDGQDTASDYHQGPYYSGFYPTHTFTQVGTAKVIVTARDRKGATSLPETVLVRVDTIGGVIWTHAAPWSSPLVVNDGFEDCVYFMPWPSYDPGGPTGFWALTTAGDHKYSADSGPSSSAAYCAATQHIVGLGRCLVAVDRQLHLAWRLSTLDTTDYSHRTDLAVRGDRIYVGDKDSLFCFIDSVDHGVRAAARKTSLPINGAPVVDAQGSVYFGTDSGFLYKVGPWLDTMFWRTRFAAGSVYSPVVGSDGTVFCASDASRIYAVDPATGTSLWTVTLLGAPGPFALGRTAIFVATGGGTAYSIDPATGAVNWSKRLTADKGISSAPAVAADGYVYFLSDDGVLYRVRQTDGTLDWACDCGYFGGGMEVSYPGKRMPSTHYPPNSAILPNGNIIVAGRSALYCVAGSPAGPLDPLAPWPKWQHDLHNTGFVGGGR